jgi:hypothetical protein
MIFTSASALVNIIYLGTIVYNYWLWNRLLSGFINLKNTHYIHSVVVQDFVSGRVCCVNQYHYELRKRRVVMRFVHTTDKIWYTVLHHQTMFVINLSNISIKTNFKQIARVELKCVQYSEGDYILCMTSRYFFRSFTNVRLLCFVSHSNGMTSCQSSLAENVSCNVVPFFYHHSVVIQHLVSDTLYQTGDFR